MDNQNIINLNYGYRECEDGIRHAFYVEDPDEKQTSSETAENLSALLETVPEDGHFNWDAVSVSIPDTTVQKIEREGMRIAADTVRQPRKTYAPESFKAKTNEKRLTATGWIAAERMRECINLSGVLSRLIRTAGRLVDFYASDLFITWEAMMNELDNACMNAMNPETDSAAFSKSYLFGFREMGVDNEKTVLCCFNDAGGNQGHYREIWRLDVNISETGTVRAELYEVNKSI